MNHLHFIRSSERIERRLCLRAFAGMLPWMLRAKLSAAQIAQDALYTEAVDVSVQRGLRYLAARQQPNGTLGVSRHSANVAIASLAGMAWLASGSTPNAGEFQQNLARQLRYVLDCGQLGGLLQEKDPAPGFGAMYAHGFGLLFLAELLGMSPEPRMPSKIASAVRLITSSQNSDGGWRYEPVREDADVSVTACQLIALRSAASAGVELASETVEKGLNYLLACRNSDGGFRYMLRDGPSEFSRSAACLTALRVAPAEAPIQVSGGIDYLMKFKPGATAAKRIQYYFYGHYYAAQAFWHVGGEAWRTWFTAIRDELLERQQQNGSWNDDISPEYGTAMACLILQTPIGYLPIFVR